MYARRNEGWCGSSRLALSSFGLTAWGRVSSRQDVKDVKAARTRAEPASVFGDPVCRCASLLVRLANGDMLLPMVRT